jgi:hypothetical protein
MKGLLPISFLPLMAVIALHTGNPVFYAKTDTVKTGIVKVTSVGVNNRVVIDSLYLGTSLNDTLPTPVTGEITQTGENNQVEINTAGQNPNDKCPMTSDPSSDKEAVSPGQHIKVTQTGRNNSVKINSK